MGNRLSPYKIQRLMVLYFQGCSQSQIAGRLKINQSSVSLYISKFKASVEDKGLLAVAEEVGTMDEIDALHSLAAELKKAKLSAEEAHEGVRILQVFDELGVSPAEHKILVKVISELKSPDFVPAAMKLIQLETATGKTYTQLVSYLEQLSSENDKLQKVNATLGLRNPIITSILFVLLCPVATLNRMLESNGSQKVILRKSRNSVGVATCQD